MTMDAGPRGALESAQSAELRSRVAAARAEMARRDLSALLLVSPENIYYLLGLDYQGYFAFSLLLLPREGPPELITRAMEGPTVAARAPDCVHRPFHDGADPVATAAAALRGQVRPGEAVGVEDSAMFFPPAIWAGLRQELPELVWVGAGDIGQQLREVKSEAEIVSVRRAASLSSEAMAAGIGAIAAGGSESRVAAAVYSTMISGGSQNPGFAPLIPSHADPAAGARHLGRARDRAGRGAVPGAVGVRAALPRPAEPHRLRRRGPARGGRRAPGRPGRCAGDRRGASAGAAASDVYHAWQDAVEQVHPQRGARRHHCGYLVGIGFPPSWVGGGEVLGIRPGSARLVRAGMTFHAMSWVTEPTGYVISDTILVTDDGCEVLTRAPRELTVL